MIGRLIDMISITSIITVQCILLYLTSNYMNFTCAFVFEQRSSWAVEMMLAPHRLVVAPPPVVVMHWKRWAFGRLQTKLPKGSKRCVQITAFRQCISECNKNEIFSRPSNTMFFFMCLYNILFECDSSLLTSLASSDSCFQCRRAHGIWKAWCISSTLYQSLASVEPIKGPPVGTVPENRMHPGMLDVFVHEKHLSYVHIQFLVVCTFWYSFD